MTPPIYIETDQALHRLTTELTAFSTVAIDTESNSLFAYRERLCLVQISTPREDYIIDPEAGVDLRALSGLFADPGIIKVFHDAEFDVLMLKRIYPFEFCSLFDTKVAATALGIARVGLASMLLDFFDVTVDKRYQRSDWGKRPLSPEQLEYATGDTRYLLEMVEELRKLLDEAGEPAILEVASECKRLCELQPEIKRFDPDEFARIKGADALGPEQRQALRELFVMRHEIADRRDSPAFKVLTNEMLVQVARAMPQTEAALGRVKALSPKLVRRHSEGLLKAIRRAEGLGPLHGRPRAAAADPMSSRERDTYERLRGWRKKTAQGRPTESSLVLSRGCMAALARLRDTPQTIVELAATGLLEPWRVHYYGEELLDVLQGRRAS